MSYFTPAIGWIWLSYLGRPNREIRNSLYTEYHTLEQIWNAAEQGGIPEWMEEKEVLRARFTDDKLRIQAAAVYERAAGAGMTVVTPDDQTYPCLLRQLHTMPCVLYCYGTMPKSAQRLLSVVGSRRCTSYGLNNASWFAGNLAQNGVGIVSGMARGIDGAAHKGALQVGGYTVAVLACGADVVYPKEHQYIYDQIRSQGCVISELPPGAPPDKRFFPARNRIIAGMSEGTLLIEARKSSGAMITVDRAVNNDKTIYAIPGNIGVPTSEGGNDLIRQGAQCVTCPEDILEDMGIVSSAERGIHLPDNISEIEKNIIMSIVQGACYADTISVCTGIPVQGIYRGLTLLEMKGFVGKNPGGTYHLKNFHFTE